MRTGDTITLMLKYNLNGVPLQQNAYDEIELQLNKDSGSKSLKKLLSQGDIVWDTVSVGNSSFEGYIVNLTQEETFALGNTIQAQLRIKKDGEVGSSDETEIDLDSVLSSKIL